MSGFKGSLNFTKAFTVSGHLGQLFVSFFLSLFQLTPAFLRSFVGLLAASLAKFLVFRSLLSVLFNTGFFHHVDITRTDLFRLRFHVSTGQLRRRRIELLKTLTGLLIPHLMKATEATHEAVFAFKRLGRKLLSLIRRIDFGKFAFESFQSLVAIQLSRHVGSFHAAQGCGVTLLAIGRELLLSL